MMLLYFVDLILSGGFRADPYAKKDWYDIKAPSVFGVRNVGKTLVTRTQGTKVIICFSLSFKNIYHYFMTLTKCILEMLEIGIFSGLSM